MSVLPIVGRSLRLATSMARRKPMPFSMTFILTNRCNFRCSYCDIPAAAGAEMSTRQLEGAIDELSRAGMARASFSGGEAMLRDDAVDLISHAKRRGAVTSLNSNAWLLEPLLPRLAPVLDVLMVSLDGPEPVHDLLRRRKGSYARAIHVLDEARSRGISTTTITVITKDNLHVVDEVLSLADSHGFWAYFQPAYEECFTFEAGLAAGIDGRLLADLAVRLQRARRQDRRVGASPGYLERLGRGPAFGRCEGCAAGRYFATVMPDGTLIPCHLTSQQRRWPNGLELGFVRAFEALGERSPGPGCAISPYQEQDLIFGHDPRAVATALARLRANR